MKSFGKLASVVSILGVLLLAAGAGSVPALAKDSDGYRVYKHRSDDLRLRLAVKGHRVQLASLKSHSTCTGDRKSGWGIYFHEAPFKIKKGGLFGFKDTDDFGQSIHTELRARIHKRTISGWFIDTYSSADQITGDWTRCWTGESYVRPKVRFKAHLVR